jgi:ribosomal protein L24E
MIPQPTGTARRVTALVMAIVMTSFVIVAASGASVVGTRYLGSVPSGALNRPIVGMASTPSGTGYWLVASDGGIFTFGNAHFYGSTGARALNRPIVGMAATRTGRGYWLVASDGGIFTFGDARFYGSTGALALNRPIVGMAATHSGRGYWLVASDGGIFTFGDARFHGSTGSRRLNAPIVGMAATPSGRGYWLVASDGGIFTFGNAPYHGSAAGRSMFTPIAGMAPTPSGRGYWVASADGSTWAFGDATAFGTRLAAGASPVVAIAASPLSGYWVAARDGRVGTSTTASSANGPGAITSELLARMNIERAARHLAPLTSDPLLAGYADNWAHTLLATKQFNHQNLGAILDASGGRFEEVGENLFAGDGAADDAGSAHVGLMTSAEHRTNMLLPQGQLVGIGAACSGGVLMVVEDFAITSGAPLPPAGQGTPAELPIVASNIDGAHC